MEMGLHMLYVIQGGRSRGSVWVAGFMISHSEDAFLRPHRGSNCGAWYTSDEIKTSDCDDFAATGECEERNVTTEESEADGLCDDCTRAREG
ncbi:hypothetical protein F5Y01DRAFT_310961 [Xylaria sp. FL0043]|nr:hypothetical protein F5Y01DRAFT_310961 [Xylaria sp. FL0043]